MLPALNFVLENFYFQNRGRITVVYFNAFWFTSGNPNKEVTFETLSGNLKARKEGTQCLLLGKINLVPLALLCSPTPYRFTYHF